MSSFYDLSTVPGYSGLVPCAQGALQYVLEPSMVFIDNCQSDVGPQTYASCLCLTAYDEVASQLDIYHNGCSEVTVWNADSVLNNFCSVELQLLAPVKDDSPTVPPFSLATTTRDDSGSATTSGSIPSAGLTFNHGFVTATSTTDSNNPTDLPNQPSSQTPSQTPISGGSARSSSHAPLAVIVVLAVVLFLVIVVLIICCCWWKTPKQWWEKRKEKKGEPHSDLGVSNYPHYPIIAGSHVAPSILATNTPTFSQVSTQAPSATNWPNQFYYPPSQGSSMAYAKPLSSAPLRPEDSLSNLGVQRHEYM